MADRRLRDRVTPGNKPDPDGAPYTDGPQGRAGRLANRIGQTVSRARELAAKQQARRQRRPETNRDVVARAGDAAHAAPPIDATLNPVTSPEDMRYFVTGGRGGMDDGNADMAGFVTGSGTGNGRREDDMAAFVMGGSAGNGGGSMGIDVEDPLGFGGDG
jgi:hypothetical protein